MEADLKSVARSYFTTWKNGDFKTMRSIFAEGAALNSPLADCYGIDEIIQILQKITPIIVDLKIQHMWVDGNDVITWYELYTSKAKRPMSVANWMHIEKGKIVRIATVYDPSPLKDVVL